MLYIVQITISGTVATPKIFADPTSARDAFIALIREHSAAAFAEYCAAYEADPDSFSTARMFADTRSKEEVCFCYWELAPAADGVAAQPVQLPEQNREPVLQAAAEAQRQVLGVQTELRRLAEKLTGMSQELIRLQTLLDNDGKEAGLEEAAVTAELSAPVPAAPEGKYQTPEWQDFIQSLIRMCGGNRGEFPLLSRQDWRHAVYSDQTALPYWEWVAITIDQAIARARSKGYAVEEDSVQSGHFVYLTPSGERSSTLYEMEDLAWCAAGLQAAEKNPPG